MKSFSPEAASGRVRRHGVWRAARKRTTTSHGARHKADAEGKGKREREDIPRVEDTLEGLSVTKEWVARGGHVNYNVNY